MKRDDEIGGGIGGSKVRKYASLIKRILIEKPECVIIEGSLNSNNVLGLIPILKSWCIAFKIATPPSHSPTRGNALWTAQITNSQEHIEIQSTSGHEHEFYEELLGLKKVYVIKEGAAQLASIPGLLSMVHEVNAFEKRCGENFNTFFIDAGTGISAIGLLAGLQLLDRNQANTVITLIAGTELDFRTLHESLFEEFNRAHGTNLEPSKSNIEFVRPTTSKSFGSFNASLVREWKYMMTELGTPIDLTYTAKHFLRVKKYLAENTKSQRYLLMNAASHTACRNHSEILASTYPKKD